MNCHSIFSGRGSVQKSRSKQHHTPDELIRKPLLATLPTGLPKQDHVYLGDNSTRGILCEIENQGISPGPELWQFLSLDL